MNMKDITRCRRNRTQFMQPNARYFRSSSDVLWLYVTSAVLPLLKVLALL